MNLILKPRSEIVGFIKNAKEKRRISVLQAEIQKKCLIGNNSVVASSSLIVNHDENASQIEIGDNTHILGQIIAYPGGAIKIGDFCYVSVDSRIWSFASVKIGNRVLIAHNVNIFDSQTHSFNYVHRHQEFLHVLCNGDLPKDMNIGKAPVSIADDVWIACGAIILKGVSIGKGAIVGAGSVVTKDVPALTLVAGNPARVVRELKAEEIRGSVSDEVLDRLNHD